VSIADISVFIEFKSEFVIEESKDIENRQNHGNTRMLVE